MSWATQQTNLLNVCLTTFGQMVTFTDKFGTASSIVGSWRTGERLRDAQRGIEGVLLCRVSDFATLPEKGEIFTIAGEEFVLVVNAEQSEDGGGGVNFYLRRKLAT